jgi:hypothetical protein
MMKLTVYHDGQFYIGLIQIISKRKFKAYRYTFGKEPKDQEVLDFVLKHLINFIEIHDQKGVSIVQSKLFKRVNPKRLQRRAAREMKQPKISTKAQEALKAEHEYRKKEKQVTSKRLREEKKAYIRKIKVQKAKSRHKGR